MFIVPRGLRSVAGASLLLAVALAGLQLVSSTPSDASSGLIGAGSSFAGNEVTAWVAQTSISPYNLDVQYTSSNSGSGRFEFAGGTIDYAVSDIPYQPINDASPPTFPFIYIPVTAGGLAFMYNLPNLSCQAGKTCDTQLNNQVTLQLSSYSACALLTGAVTNWDDPVIQADNPNVVLPNLKVTP